MTLFLDQEQHLLHCGDIYLINRCQVHSFISQPKPCLILAFQVHTDLYRRIRPDLAFLQVESSIFCSGVLHHRLKTLLFSCAKFYFSQESYRELKCSSLLLDAFSHILNGARCTLSGEKASNAAQNNILRLNRITDYILGHFSENISLSDLANLEHISPCHLSHFMKQMIGITVFEYISQVRFEHALQLINTTNLSILDICMETGFSSSRYLNQMFEKHMGCSAKEYRQAEEKPRLLGPALPGDHIQKRYSFEQSAFLFGKIISKL